MNMIFNPEISPVFCGFPQEPQVSGHAGCCGFPQDRRFPDMMVATETTHEAGYALSKFIIRFGYSVEY